VKVEKDNYAEIKSSAGYIAVPFHYQDNSYYCGPAALEMAFDYYGADVPQVEIADVTRTNASGTFTDELRRAAHFSNLSTSLSDEIPGNITGYSARQFGYAAFKRQGLTIEHLKSLIDEGDPVIVLMWWTSLKQYAHYRVVVGYNSTHVITHDSWNTDWGGEYGGANTSMTSETFLELWSAFDYWGLWIHPWSIELHTPSLVRYGDYFEIVANITYLCPPPFDPIEYPSSSCNTTIQLQEGLKLASGETPQHALGDLLTGDSVQTSWRIHADATGTYNISVAATGLVEDSYPYSYVDAIGGLATDSIIVVNQTRRVHNLDTGLNYTSIQTAIDADATLSGHTIYVEEGVYYEHLVVSKSVSLIGQNRENTIIDGELTEDVVRVTRDSVNITGFKIRRSGRILFNAGVSLSNVKDCDISGNRIVDNFVGVYGSPTNTSISNNIIIGNHVGVDVHDTIHNIVSENHLTANNVSLHLYNADSNNIFENNMINNWRSITLGYSMNNKLYHNRFFNNTEPILILVGGYTNFWDDSYPSGGNYWSDYNGSDSNNDGIGDTPHVLDGNNTDNYPLAGMYSDFDATTEHSVQTICNSSITVFNYNGSTINFKATSEDGIVGFCRITTPTALMNETYRVFVDGTEVPHTLLPVSNSTHSYLYFNYNHSTKEVTIIPEYPSLLILPLFMLTTLLTALVCRRKRTKSDDAR